jgi:hypothetical protein
MPKDYTQFLIKAIDLNIGQIANYFHSKHLEHKEDNRNFIDELGNAITIKRQTWRKLKGEV